MSIGEEGRLTGGSGGVAGGTGTGGDISGDSNKVTRASAERSEFWSAVYVITSMCQCVNVSML